MKSLFLIIALLSVQTQALEGFDEQRIKYPQFEAMYVEGRGEFLFDNHDTPIPGDKSPKLQNSVLKYIHNRTAGAFDRTEPGLGSVWNSYKVRAGSFGGGAANYALTVADYADDWFSRQHVFIVTLQSRELGDSLAATYPALHPERNRADVMGVIVFTYNGFILMTPGAPPRPLDDMLETPIAIITVSNYDQPSKVSNPFGGWVRWWH